MGFQTFRMPNGYSSEDLMRSTSHNDSMGAFQGVTWRMSDQPMNENVRGEILAHHAASLGSPIERLQQLSKTPVDLLKDEQSPPPPPAKSAEPAKAPEQAKQQLPAPKKAPAKDEEPPKFEADGLAKLTDGELKKLAAAFGVPNLEQPKEKLIQSILDKQQ